MAQFPAKLIRELAAGDGRPFPGRAACSALASRLRDGTLTSREDIEYLASALEAIAQGKDANTALRIKRDRKRPSKGERDRWIYERVEELTAGGAMKLTQAYEQVGLELQSYGEFKERDESPADEVGKIHRRLRRVNEEIP